MMFRAVLASLIGIVCVAAMTGCDEAVNDAAKLVLSARGFQSGDLLMDQTRQQNQLRDGTGANCPNPDCTGGGGGDQLRLRDGSCQN